MHSKNNVNVVLTGGTYLRFVLIHFNILKNDVHNTEVKAEKVHEIKAKKNKNKKQKKKNNNNKKQKQQQKTNYSIQINAMIFALYGVATI